VLDIMGDFDYLAAPKRFDEDSAALAEMSVRQADPAVRCMAATSAPTEKTSRMSPSAPGDALRGDEYRWFTRLVSGKAISGLRAGTKRAQTRRTRPVSSDTSRHRNLYTVGKR
jgi:hypothetical protein